ncbi:MAG: IPT/TIG domain-containing protein, partial [Thermoanaerobaculia bacterium]
MPAQRHERPFRMSIQPVKKTMVAIALALLLPAMLLAQDAPSLRELVPATAPAGARVLVSGRGLADPSLAVTFAGTAAAAIVVQRTDRAIEVVVPANAVTGNVRVTSGSTLVGELPFTVATEPRYIVSTLAGGPRSQNNPLKHPWGAAVILPTGNVAVADEQHHRIILLTPSGQVSVLAGDGKQGLKDGKGTSARFKDPRGIAFDVQRDVLYVSDSGNHAVRQVALDGTVTTLAGHSGKQGYEDGPGSAAKFKSPHGLTVGGDGAIYVADTKNHRIRRVALDGTVTTFAGTGERGGQATDGPRLGATFNEPRGIVAAGSDLYIADTKNNAIRKISEGQVTTVLAFPRTGDEDDPGDSGDGNPNILNRPSGIGVDDAGNLIVSDSENDFVRRIALHTSPATMTTIAGTGRNGFVDGDGAVAQFKDPVGLTVAGAIYLADEDNDALRRLCPEVRATGLFVPTGALSAGTAVRLFGTGFVPGGTSVTFDGVAATNVTWINSTAIAVKLPQNLTGGSVVVSITACGGTTQPVSFVVDNTPPVLTITNGGAPLADASMFRVPVTSVITAVDETDPAPTVTATLNGVPFTSGTTVSADGIYTLAAIAEDAAGNRATQTIHFTIDATPPVVEVLEGITPFPSGAFFNRPVVIDLNVADLTSTTHDVRIDGAPYVLKQPYAVEGPHELIARVTDALGNETTIGPIAFTIDTIPPALAFTSHGNGQIVSARDALITGGSDDAISVKVNGADAVLDSVAKTFSFAAVLLEGENVMTATAVDRAGNAGTASLTLVLDTRAPELTIDATPACTNAASLDLRGTIVDPNIDKVEVRLGDTTVSATVAASAWSATLSLGDEGSKAILVEGTDSVGHVNTRSVTVVVDRTAPAIEISESGTPFTATLAGRAVALFVRANDADPSNTAMTTLDGTAYTSGAQVAAEGEHTIRVVAKDCAGNESTREHTFIIDLTAPRFLTFTPASGSKVTQVPSALGGTTDTDAVEVRILGTDVTA